MVKNPMVPITDSKNLVVGGKYLEFLVYSGGMSLEAFTVSSKPEAAPRTGVMFFNNKYHYLPWRKSGRARSVDQRFFSDCGIDLKPGSHDNHHRVFKDTRRNRRVLQEILAQRNLDKYLEIIDIHKIDAAA